MSDPTLEECMEAAIRLDYSRTECPICGTKLADIGQNQRGCCEYHVEKTYEYWRNRENSTPS